MTLPTTQPRASGDESQPVVGLLAAPHPRSEGQGVGQSGPARRYVLCSFPEASFDRESGRVMGEMRGRPEAAKLCRRLNGGKR